MANANKLSKALSVEKYLYYLSGSAKQWCTETVFYSIF